MPKNIQERTKPVQLTYWRVFDDSDAFDELLNDYAKLHPNVSITYRKLRYDEFEKKLLEALAEDRGPDIFSIHNAWTRGYQSKLLPLPDTLSIPYRTVEGAIKKEVVWTLKTEKALSIKDLKIKYPDQVAEDVVLQDKDDQGNVKDKIFGLPLSIDSLALFYNKELLNAAGIAKPAEDWSTFQSHVKKLTKQDSSGNITQAGAAIGGSNNVERSTDILSILMMQNGAQMADSNGYATFNKLPVGLEDRTMTPGVEALTFYTDFASPQKEVYTWTENMPNSLDAFIQGKAAYFFGYAYHLSAIKSRAPKLQYGISKLPQITGNKEINFANYWVEVVSKKTKYANEACDFAQFIADEKNVGKYLDKTAKPTALRNLIQKQSEDINLYTFVSQLLTAKSWYRGKNALNAETAIKEMVGNVLSGSKTAQEAIELGVQKVNQTI